ncbi:MAG: tetratricopeptide repeat protein [Parvularcula sp.]|jgi:tetratricopeptide (TPR) repeat protein|nr:tetratricopeptide repeat protein [Parvularcula sp.]
MNLRIVIPLLALFATTACASLNGSAFGPDEPSVSGAYLRGRFAAQAFDLSAAEEAFGEVAAQRALKQGQRTAFAYALAAGSVSDAADFARDLVPAASQETEGLDGDEAAAVSIQSDLPIVTLATEAMRRGRPGDALGYLDEPFESALGRSLAALLRSAAAYEADGFGAATDAIQAQEPGTFRGLVPLHAAFLFELEKQDEAALTAYRQALTAPRGEIAAIAYGRLLETTGREEEAAAIYRRMVADAGVYTRAGRMGLARIGALDGEGRRFVKRAKAMPRTVTNADELFALTLENYAWIGFQQALQIQGDDTFAEQRRNNALVIPLTLANLARSLAPERDVAHHLAATIFALLGNEKEAMEAASKVDPRSWIYEYSVLQRAGAAYDLEGPPAGAEVLTKALKDEPGSPQWALQLHNIYASDGRSQEAADAGAEAVASAQRLGFPPLALWRYHFARGVALQEAGDWEAARAELEQALNLAPDEPTILNHLGYSLAERGEELERAFEMIERALKIEPQNGAIVDSLGWAYFQLAEYEKALPYLERAVKLEPADSTITDHLGDAYYMVGREREARYEWQRVLTLDDATDDVKKAVEAKLSGDVSALPPLPGGADR